MAQIKFITSGANSAFGGFSSGDILVCSEEMANHLVNEIGCAKYADLTPVVTESKESKPRARKTKQ